MICSSHKICQCSTSFHYFNPASENCIAQGTYSASCSIDYNCRVDRYLTCINGQCNCISAYPTWSNGFNKCIMPGTYTETCYATSDCSTSKSLVCSNGTSCSCPNNLSTGKCDCPIRVNSYELFWDGSSCTTALNNTQSCSVDYMCQMLTQGTSCSGSTCICPATQYFNSGTYKCETLLIVNQTCSQSDACNTGLGLSCQSGSCKCSSSQFWKSNSIGCINYYNYNNGTCSDTNQCQTSLICKNATSLSCNCPTTVSTSYCDCPAPVYGAEYYWNGSYCVVAQTYNQTCTLSYQCQMLTQLTTCTNSKCICFTTQYFNSGTYKCETLLIVNQTCSQSDACNTGLGLSCQSGSCKCSSSQFWKSNSIGCINYYNYNNGTCSDTNQCQTSLICKNATSLSCNCPTTVSTSYCDCPAPVYGAEYYWNGSYCVVAQTYNQTCTLSYQCQMLTQLTTCTGSPLKCVCSSTSYWSFTKTKCLSCPAGWIYHRLVCSLNFLYILITKRLFKRFLLPWRSSFFENIKSRIGFKF